MSSLDQAVETQLKNIETETGTSRDQLKALLLNTNLTKHSELRAHAQSALGLRYGDANALVHFALASDGTRAAEGKSDDDVLSEIYTGSRAALRPVH